MVHSRPDLRIVPPPADHVAVRFIPSRAASHAPPFGERLVRFFRRWQFHIFIACYAVAVVTACYFAFRLGLGR